MEIQGILKNLREKNNLTQEQLAERVQVTRQAVSRWETGETQPNTDTLKLLSRVFRCVNQYAFGFSTATCLSVLRNAIE